MKNIFILLAVLVLQLQTLPAIANSENLTAFLENLDGSYKGRGKASVSPAADPQKIVCRVVNSFMADTSTLHLEGDCATTQGKVKIDAEFSVVGGKFQGSFLAPIANSKVTKSNGVLVDGNLVVSTSYVNNGSGGLTRVRQIISPKESGGFHAKFLKFDHAAGDYLETGNVEFKAQEGS